MKLMPFTIFLDILGYSELNKNINSDEKANEVLELIEKIKNILLEDLEIEKKMPYPIVRIAKTHIDIKEIYHINIAFVSDSIVISYQPKEISTINKKIAYQLALNELMVGIVRSVANVIFQLLYCKKMFIRGGVSSKYSMIKDNLLVGEGIIEAYQLEHHFAKNPRIIISQNIIATNNMRNKFHKNLDLNNILKSDKDNFYYIDYLKIYFKKEKIRDNIFSSNRTNLEKFELVINMHKEAIEYNILNNKHNTKILEKYKWLKEYHNGYLIDIINELNKYENAYFNQYTDYIYSNLTIK